jgi:hypothetical protein
VLFKTISSFFENYSKGGCSLALLEKEDHGSLKCAWNGNGPILLAQNCKSFTSLMDDLLNLVHEPWINFIHDHLYLFTSITDIHHS